MQTCVEEETDEVPNVPLSDARAHPRTMVVVHLNAKTTVCAVEGPRRSYYLTRVTV